MKYELPQMLKQGAGAIVNTSSVAGLVGFEELPAYVASKHGIAGLTRTAALEYAQHGIRVNAVCPGVIQTPMIDRIVTDPETEAQFTALEPIGRMGSPEEIAHAVVWLCSDAASFVTGVPMPVDGGLVAAKRRAPSTQHPREDGRLSLSPCRVADNVVYLPAGDRSAGLDGTDGTSKGPTGVLVLAVTGGRPRTSSACA